MGREGEEKLRYCFTQGPEYEEMARMLERWQEDPSAVKEAFLRLGAFLAERKGARLSFKARPGVSYSLRAAKPSGVEGGERLFALVDVIDDPNARYLSVCFYEETVTDPEGLGETIPGGILGEDGYCFTVEENDPVLLSYLERRVLEAAGEED